MERDIRPEDAPIYPVRAVFIDADVVRFSIHCQRQFQAFKDQAPFRRSCQFSAPRGGSPFSYHCLLCNNPETGPGRAREPVAS